MVNGSTTGSLDLLQRAIGGEAGYSSTGTPGIAGAATSSLTHTNTLASLIRGEVHAQGGSGSGRIAPFAGGSGGDAISNIEITGNSRVEATARSNGGQGGNGSTAGLAGLSTATAEANTVQGFRAIAQTRATGRVATATARSRASGGPISSLLVTGYATNHFDLQTQTLAAVADVEAFCAGCFPSYHALGNTKGLPPQADVTNELAGDADVSLAYSVGGLNRTALALLELQTNTPSSFEFGERHLSVTADYSFNLGLLQSGNLLVGLLDPTSSGPAFTSLHFTIKREGATVEDQTFLTQAAATTYFNDHVLNFGDIDTGVTGTLDLSISLEMVSPNIDTKFNTTLLVADIGPNILPGDYNNDGKVDARDYVVFRNNEGTATVLPNDPHGGTIGVAQYNTWRANFGEMAGSGASVASVPEPAAYVLLAAASLPLVTRRRYCSNHAARCYA